MRQIILTPIWLRNLIVVLLVVGIFFRFYNLHGKVYWHDEAFTSMRISGYTTPEVLHEIFNGRVITKKDFTQYQSINSERNLGDVVKSLAVDNPEHPPVYYIIVRLWVQFFGNSITAIRSLSASISLLIFPSIYWLCRELFKVPLSVFIMIVALVAISPINLVYAQEAREYTLWVVTVLLSSASLLRAMWLESQSQGKSFKHHKHQRVESFLLIWGIYIITLTLSLYTSLLSEFVAVAHGIYILVIAKFRWCQTVKAYWLASLAGVLLFLPWIVVVIVNKHRFRVTTAWMETKIFLGDLIQAWLLEVSRIFVDFDLNLNNPLNLLITLSFLVLVGYSIYFICVRTSPRTSVFVVSLITIPALALMLPDLLFGGQRSVGERYLLPSVLGIQIAVAYTLATQLYTGYFLRRRVWQIITALVITSGVLSCLVNSQADTWWNKVVSYDNRQLAAIINQSQRPILVSNSWGTNFGNILSLSHLVEEKVHFQLVEKDEIPKIPQKFTDVFLLNPSTLLQQGIEAKYNFQSKVVYQDQYYSLLKLFKLN